MRKAGELGSQENVEKGTRDRDLVTKAESHQEEVGWEACLLHSFHRFLTGTTLLQVTLSIPNSRTPLSAF